MKIKAFTKKALAMLVVAVMMIGVLSPVVSALGPIEDLIKRDGHNTDTLHYVSLGASNTNGFGHHGYLPPEVYEDPLAANKAQMNDYGYLKEPENAYPNLIKEALAEATGREVELHQLAISSMRVEEVLYLIDDSYIPDEYMEWRFTGGKSWFDAAEDGGIPALKEAYTNYITEADVITVDLGWNNFGVYAFNNIMTILKEGGSRYWKAPAFDRVVDAGKEAEYYEIRDKAMARLNEMVDLSETALSENVIEMLADVLAYAAFGACYNYDKVIEKIYELNPDAKVITINIQNLADELVVDLDGTQIPLGDLYGELIEFVDFYRASESPYADKVLFAYAGEDGDVDTFLDEFRLWDGDPATLSQDMKDLFDMYDDNLYVRSKIEYIMVGQVFGQIFAELRNTAESYSLSAFENDEYYTYEIPAFDMTWIQNIDLASLDFNNPDSGIEHYGAAVSKHLVNLRNYEGDGKNAYNYVFDNLTKNLTGGAITTLDAAIAQRDGILSSLPPEQQAEYAQLIQFVTILETARKEFNNAFYALYMVYTNTLNYAYDTVGTIIQYSLQFNTFYLTPDSMSDHNSKTDELLGYVVNTFTNNTMLKFYEELGKVGMDNSGTVAPEITVNEELFSDPIIQAVAALEVRYDFGNSFFAHPSVNGMKQIRDAVMDVLENGSHADRFIDKKLVLYIDLFKKYLASYYESKFENADLDATVDTIVGGLDSVDSTMDALEKEILDFEIPADANIDREAASEVKDLIIEEITNVKATTNEIREVLQMDTLELINTDFEAKLLGAQKHLENHLNTLIKLTKQLGYMADPYVSVALSHASAVAKEVEAYVGAVTEATLNAYDNLVEGVEGFKEEYIAFAELVGSYADKLDANLGKEVRSFLLDTPAEALNIIVKYGEDAVLKFIVDAASAGETLYSSVVGIVAVLAQHGADICERVLANEEYSEILEELKARFNELSELYAALEADPLLTLIDIDIIFAEHLADLEALYARLVPCVMADVEKYDSEVAELLRSALTDAAASLGIIAEAGEGYVDWLDGRTAMMLGALLQTLIDNSLDLGKATEATIWKYLNMLNTFIMNTVEQTNAYLLAQLQALRNELAELEENITSRVLAKLEKLEAMINAGVTDVKALVAAIEELAAEVDALVKSIENGVNDPTCENLLAIISNLRAIDDMLSALLGDRYDELKDTLNGLALKLLDRAVEELKKSAPYIDEAIYDYLKNNPEEVLDFFRTYGHYLEKLADKYGDEVLGVFAYIFYEYGEDVLAHVLENPEKSLDALCGWYEKYGARILPLIKIYVDVLGLDSLVAENVDLALAELNAMLDELNAKLNALVNELGVRFNNDVLPHVFELLANLEKQIDYITSLPEELKEQALAELNRMLNELKTLIESIINDAITGEYTVDEGSFLVSITGANSEYAQLLAGALGLGERFAIMNWYDIDKALLEKADLVTIGYDYAQIHNFTLTQLLGAVAAYTDESLRAQTIAFLHEVLDGNMENQYIDNYVTRVNDAIDSILEHPVLAGKETVELDWKALVGAENVEHVEALLAEIELLLEENGINGNYVLSIDVAKILAKYELSFSFLEEGTMFNLSIPAADLVLTAVESYLYANIALELTYAETIVDLVSKNPDVQIALLGQYNPLMDLTVAGVRIPLAEIGEKLSDLASARSFAFALALPNVTYVDISGVKTNWSKEELEITLDMVVDYLSNPEDALFTDADNLYVMTQILNAYGLTCKHVYDGCTDLVCNICGEAREAAEHNYTSVVTKPTCTAEGYTTHTCSVCGDSYVDTKVAALGHKYDNACDADCNVCGEKRTPAEHVFGDWTFAEEGKEKRECTVCGYTEYRDVTPAPITPINPTLVIVITVTVASAIALAGAFLFKKFKG